MKSTITSLLLIFAFNLTYAQVITGTWNGELDVNGTSLRIVFHVEKNGDTYKTLMDSPDQGAKDIPTDKTTFDGETLSVEAAQLGMSFSGKLSEENTQLIGEFKQGPATFPLTFKREVPEKKVMLRPQDPREFPYRVEEVTFENTSAKVTLAGTLTLPKEGTPKSVVVLISGSGAQNRDEEVIGINHRPFLVLSDYLTRNGIGVLRYDERGVAASTGDFSTATTADFAADTEAAVYYLSQRADLKGASIGLIGHSEGGLIAPMVASKNKAIDFIVLLAAPAIPIPELLILQSKLISEAEKVPTNIMEANHKILKEAYAFLVENPNLPKEDAQTGLVKIFRAGLKHFPESVQASITDKDTFVETEAKGLLGPWFRYFIAFNPATYLEQVTCPVLALNGTLDLQVPADENLNAIEQNLSKAGNQQFVIKRMEQLNHLFQKATTGAPSEYKMIEETFNEAAMEAIALWVQKQ